jgi:hypothetical protein
MLSASFLSVMIVFLVIIHFKSKWTRISAKHRQELGQFSCPFPSLPIVGNCYAFAGEPTRKQFNSKCDYYTENESERGIFSQDFKQFLGNGLVNLEESFTFGGYLTSQHLLSQTLSYSRYTDSHKPQYVTITLW